MLGSDFSIGGMAGNWFLWGEGGGVKHQKWKEDSHPS